MRKIVMMLMVAAASALAMGQARAEARLNAWPSYTAAEIAELEKQPDSVQTKVKLFQAYSRNNEHQKAAAILGWLLKNRPDYPWLGSAIFINGLDCPGAWKPAELKAAWRAALAKDPDNPALLENVAKSLTTSDKPLVQECMTKLLKVQPDNAAANLFRGDDYRLAGKPELALPYYQSAARNAKDNKLWQALDMIARTALSMGNTALAAESAQKLLDCKDAPSNDRYDACITLGRAALRESMPEKDAAFSTNYSVIQNLPGFLKYRHLEIPKANIDKAAEWLKKAAECCRENTPEGAPKMILACELYGLGRSQDVLDFLETLAKRCKAEPDSSYGMKDYIAAIKAGRAPNWKICW